MSAVMGSQADKKAHAANKANLAATKALYGGQYNKAYGSLQKGMHASTQGYLAAKQAAAQVAHQGQVAIQNKGTQTGAALKSDLIGKGLGNTTAVGNAALANAGMVNAASTQHSAATASIAAQIEQQNAQTKAQGYMNLANLDKWMADGLGGGVMANTQHKSGGAGMWDMAGNIMGGIDWGKADWGSW